MTTMRVVGECFFWYRLTRVFPDKFHRAVKRLCVCVCLYVLFLRSFCWSVVLSVVKSLCFRMADSIEMPFWVEGRVGPRYHVLDGVPVSFVVENVAYGRVWYQGNTACSQITLSNLVIDLSSRLISLELNEVRVIWIVI